jgi:hypothetical protein
VASGGRTKGAQGTHTQCGRGETSVCLVLLCVQRVSAMAVPRWRLPSRCEIPSQAALRIEKGSPFRTPKGTRISSLSSMCACFSLFGCTPACVSTREVGQLDSEFGAEFPCVRFRHAPSEPAATDGGDTGLSQLRHRALDVRSRASRLFFFLDPSSSARALCLPTASTVLVGFQSAWAPPIPRRR